MTYLAINQINTIAHLMFPVVGSNGFMLDAYEVKFAIWDKTTPASPAQVFPAAPGTFETVTSGGGKYDTGVYWAYDNANVRGWRPEVGANEGRWYIDWRWTEVAGGTEKQLIAPFDVTPVATDQPRATILSHTDIREEGVLVATVSDARLTVLIARVQALIERKTRSLFHPHLLSWNFDGNGTDLLQVGIPIIGIEELMLNESTATLTSTTAKVYNNTVYPDDRYNPRIKLVQGRRVDDFFSRAIVGTDRNIFESGRQNQYIKGVFGFTESDLTAPLILREAAKRIVLATIPLMTAGSSSSSASGPVTREVTDRHEIWYQDATGALASRTSALLVDKESEEAVLLYRAPIAMGAPATIWLG